MKKSMIAVVVAGSLMVGSAQADFAGAVGGATSTYKQAMDFKKNVDKKIDEIKTIMAQVKKTKGGEQGKGMTQVLDKGLSMMDDVSKILVSVISTLGEALDTIPSALGGDKVKPAINQLNALLYANDADKEAKDYTGSIGSVVTIIALMKQISAKFAAEAAKAAQSQAAGSVEGTNAKVPVAKDALLEF